MIGKNEIQGILNSFRDKRILVVGDLMLDRYITGAVDRISPEAPVPVLRVASEYSRPGGAANVALNVRALGAQAVVGGVVGEDARGAELLGLLEEDGVDTGPVVRNGISTIVKTRVLAEHQQVVRVDREHEPEDIAEAVKVLGGRIEELLASVDGVIIEDYGKGTVTSGLVGGIISGARAGGKPVALDPKDAREIEMAGITLVTPNYREACLAAGIAARSSSAEGHAAEELGELSRRLYQRWQAQILIITLGAHGMWVVENGGAGELIGTRAREVYDVSGAGDTVVAAALAALVGGAEPLAAAAFANYAAGVVVGKVGTAVCTAEEVLGAVGEDGGS